MVSAQVRRAQIAYVRGRGVSQRRACALLSVSRSTLGYQLRLPLKDAPVLGAMRDLAAQYPRYGYRRIHVFLGRRGFELSPDRAHRIWRSAGLQVPRKRPRRRVASSRPRPLAAWARNQVWAYDFVFDACANGQQLKCLTVIDEFTRECFAIDVASGIRSKRVIEVLARLVSVCVFRRCRASIPTQARPSFRSMPGRCGSGLWTVVESGSSVNAPWRVKGSWLSV